MGCHATKQQFIDAREAFRHKIGAKIMYQLADVELWHWPHPRGASALGYSRDRTIMVRLHRDGAWDCALLCEQMALADLEKELHQMAGRNDLLKRSR